MSRASTNALTKRYLEWRGTPVETVQRFYGGKRHDLFGIIDTVALFPWGQMWVQNCAYGSLKAHRDQIDASRHLPWIDGQQTLSVELWEWRKKKVGRRAIWSFRAQKRAQGVWSPVGPWVEALAADLSPLKEKTP